MVWPFGQPYPARRKRSEKSAQP